MSQYEGRPTLAGRIAVITGGASGIGEACARKLFSLGSTVVISDVNEERGNAIVQELKSSVKNGSSLDAVFIKTDMSQGEQTKKFAQTVLEMFGTVNVHSFDIYNEMLTVLKSY
jgi:3-hydroxyacyl-CoA dehydrogenase/3-hydroxy-2-methylbutyryl-CoA dehydrogenase